MQYMYMLNFTIYCLKKRSEINDYFLLNTYSFSTLKFNSLSKSSRIPIAFCTSSIYGLMIGSPSTFSHSFSSELPSWVPVTSAIISAFVSLPCDKLTSISEFKWDVSVNLLGKSFFQNWKISTQRLDWIFFYIVVF